jgi:hypothetical protein
MRGGSVQASPSPWKASFTVVLQCGVCTLQSQSLFQPCMYCFVYAVAIDVHTGGKDMAIALRSSSLAILVDHSVAWVANKYCVKRTGTQVQQLHARAAAF